MGASRGRDQIPDKSVIRAVFTELLPQPLVEHEHRLHSDMLGVGTNQIPPFGGPMIGPLDVSGKHRIDELFALVRRGVGKEGSGLVRIRQQPQSVETGSSQELRVAARLRSDEAKAFVSLCGEAINLIGHPEGGIPVMRQKFLGRDGDSGESDEIEIAH